MEYIKDYDFPIIYHPGKVNVVADALSRKSGCLASMQGFHNFQQFEELGVEFQPLGEGSMIANMSRSEPIFIQRIKDSQMLDPDLVKIMEHIADHGEDQRIKDSQMSDSS